MCLAVPLRLIRVDESAMTGVVEVVGGELEVGLMIVPDAAVGEFILIHAGMAIERIDADDAGKMLDDIAEYASIPDMISPGEDPADGC